jgi:hypothetical protein
MVKTHNLGRTQADDNCQDMGKPQMNAIVEANHVCTPRWDTPTVVVYLQDVTAQWAIIKEFHTK